MSGHSKWNSIKHKKKAQDAKRGKIFSRLNKEIMTAARLGGGDPNANPRLRTAVAAAKQANMPKDNIERAIKKGTGELEGVQFEELVYEGYGPGGVAILVEILTDNKNRATAEIRHIFSKSNGSLGPPNCVAWMFDKKGLIVFDKESTDEDSIMEVALEAGAEDIKEEDDQIEVFCDPSDFTRVKEAFDAAQMEYALAEVSMIPQNTVRAEGKDAQQILRLMEALEDHDDVHASFSNFDIPEEILEEMA